MTTFADIPVNAHFHMDMAGRSDVLCVKTSDTGFRFNKLNSPGHVDAPASPIWEVKTRDEYRKEQERRSNFQRQKQYMEDHPVRGHSSTYPYGEIE